mmetsp:Transcript_51568/g.159782  ORF Transcript_51568/g.159782 Transcript_51568/m.159782 type:complete len:357 (-) Transcript_51568:4-1074(-)
MRRSRSGNGARSVATTPPGHQEWSEAPRRRRHAARWDLAEQLRQRAAEEWEANQKKKEEEQRTGQAALVIQRMARGFLARRVAAARRRGQEQEALRSTQGPEQEAALGCAAKLAKHQLRRGRRRAAAAPVAAKEKDYLEQQDAEVDAAVARAEAEREELRARYAPVFGLLRRVVLPKQRCPDGHEAGPPSAAPQGASCCGCGCGMGGKPCVQCVDLRCTFMVCAGCLLRAQRSSSASKDPGTTRPLLRPPGRRRRGRRRSCASKSSKEGSSAQQLQPTADPRLGPPLRPAGVRALAALSRGWQSGRPHSLPRGHRATAGRRGRRAAPERPEAAACRGTRRARGSANTLGLVAVQRV